MTTTPWPPCDSNGCIQIRAVDDRVEIRDTEYPEVRPDPARTAAMAADPITARLTALRKQHGYTQHQVAALSGVSRSAIARVEAEGTCYSIHSALLLAPVFGLELALVERSAD